MSENHVLAPMYTVRIASRIRLYLLGMVLKTSILVEAKNISKKYHRGSETIMALGDVSLTISKGELLAIVGPSGSGKTTLTHIIGGLSTPDTGMVVVEGRELKKQSDKLLSAYRNSEVGFIFQNFGLVPSYSAIENVMIPLVVANLSAKQRYDKAKESLVLVGLQKRMHQRADELSGGEQQRVSIARALVNAPKIIIADEPTGSLDSARGEEIMKILEDLAHKQGISVLMVTHDMGLAARADRIIHIRDGRIEKESHANN
ncbi:MAG: transporter ATPase [Candidatus Saccharibacteria bacterium]|nr:transporter ATPase [Candidatus Saccharibacteria bacterium]